MSHGDIFRESREACLELLDAARLKPGDILVVGCSSSEIVGGNIGKHSSPEAALEVYEAIAPLLDERGIYLAAQCCEHLNRALIMERQAVEDYRLEPVNVRPRPKAGGSFATAAFESMNEPVAVEAVRAAAGLDIGDTFIGMHLRPVAVPLRLHTNRIGEAHVTAARTRAKLIGGSRAEYLSE